MHGTRGSSKSETQLAKFAQHVNRGFGAYWNGVVFDRAFKNLDDLIAKSHKMFPLFDKGARFYASKSDYRWVFSDGAELAFRHAKDANDYRSYHGQEIAYIAINELTSYANDEFYKLIKSCMRTSYTPKQGEPALPMCMFSTTNPLGSGHSWVKSHFIDGAPDCTPQVEETKIFDPKLGAERIIESSKVAIFSSYRENIHLDARYVSVLENIKDVNQRKAWLDGDWSVTSGGAIDDLFSSDTHVIPWFEVPANWQVVRGFDPASSQPFAVCWIAIANGEEAIMPDGSVFCPPNGSMILIDEIYGGEKDADGKIDYACNRGLKLPIREVARLIHEKEDEMIERGTLKSKPFTGYADNSLFSVNDVEFGSQADVMADEGITWQKSDKSAGSRVRRLELFRSMLHNSILKDGAGFYVCNHVEGFFKTVVSIGRDPKLQDAYDTGGSDHLADALCYCLTAKDQAPSRTIDVGFDW